MADRSHLNILRKGITHWNKFVHKWEYNHSESFKADLRGANLFGMDLQEAQLKEADLRDADLSGVLLINASLHWARLSRVNFSRADAHAADFSFAKLMGAGFHDADLSFSNFMYANCRKANFSRADLSVARIIGANFTDVILKDCRVFGVSAWGVNLAGATQANLLIGSSDDNVGQISVDNLAVAQFIHLILTNTEIRHVIDKVPLGAADSSVCRSGGFTQVARREGNPSSGDESDRTKERRVPRWRKSVSRISWRQRGGSSIGQSVNEWP